MEARALLLGTLPARAIVTFVVALTAALLLGGLGGYLIRGLTIPAAAAPAPLHSVTVVESPPYGAPPTSPVPYPTFGPPNQPIDQSGRVTTI